METSSDFSISFKMQTKQYIVIIEKIKLLKYSVFNIVNV